MKNYIEQIRQKIGNEKFIHPAARILIENEQGEFLFILRNDNNKLGIPAGALEWEETIVECIKREVKEETGLTISAPVMIGLSTQPALEQVQYPNGDQIQYFTVEFYSNTWAGTLDPTDKNEVTNSRFLDASNLKSLPKNEYNTVESLEYFRETGRVRIR